MKYLYSTLFMMLLFSNSILFAQNSSTGRDLGTTPGIITAEKIEIKADDVFVTDRDSKTKDQQVIDDYIVTGSLAVGFDAVLNENFGFNTILLKENNLRIGFDDTSVDGGTFPNNDWALVANSTLSGGPSYFAIEDVTAGRIPFMVMAGAPVNSLYVASGGNVGLNTSNPVMELHIKDNDSPGIRFEQDNTTGWPAYTWDIAGNETNFFIRDVTGGSKLPFKIRPGAPDNAFYINTNGNIGFGTTNPSELLHVTRSAKIDSSLILGAYDVMPANPELGEISLDASDNNLKFYNGTTWTFLTSQGLKTAALVGTVLELNIGDGQNINVDLSPLLTDLEARITALEQTTGTKVLPAYTSARLFQNYPNPFVDQTLIPLYIPNSVTNANLTIYNVNGEKIKQFTITDRENCSLTLKSSDLLAGTYFYSLNLDNTELESKILIKLD